MIDRHAVSPCLSLGFPGVPIDFIPIHVGFEHVVSSIFLAIVSHDSAQNSKRNTWAAEPMVSQIKERTLSCVSEYTTTLTVNISGQ